MQNDEYRAQLFGDVARALELGGARMCVLRNYTGYPDRIGSDVDAIVEDPLAVPRILSQQKVAEVVRAARYATKNFYILHRRQGGENVFLNLDVSADYEYFGRRFFDAEEILGGRRDFKFFQVPSAEVEFGAYLTKHVSKRSLGATEFSRLAELYARNRTGCEEQVARFFPRHEAELIVSSVRSGDWQPVKLNSETLRRGLLSKTGREQRARVLLYHLGAPGRRLLSIVQPAGLMVALLGVDGAGKTAVVSRVEADLSPAFENTKLYHRRPLASLRRWFQRSQMDVDDGDSHIFETHGQPYRSLAASLFKLGFWWVDYVFVGYLMDIRPRLVDTTLVLFDRYYYDLLVYPKRYRYGGPQWLARFVGSAIPEPHLVILLDAPPEVIQARKQEVAFEEIVRQRAAYLELVGHLRNGHVVDGSKPLGEVVTEVEEIILHHMVARTRRRLRPWGAMRR